ncbi:MAG: hypothetical protein U0229_00970 [Anaeromyxobacter sp.]
MLEETGLPSALPEPADLVRYAELKLAAIGEPAGPSPAGRPLLALAGPLLRSQLEKDRLLGWPLPPVDARIQAFLDAYLAGLPGGVPRLPGRTLSLDRPGLARVLSLPPGRDHHASPYLQSFRLQQGVLHNPAADRRTTQGVFHVADGGLPVPADKLEVPRRTFAALLDAALRPPGGVLALPFTGACADPARVWTSLLLRPTVCPATDRAPARSMEVRFLAPGSLVANLDFVETIFGNAGDPFLPEHDAALDVSGWTGHTGCVILAPHLVGLRARDLGLPHEREATARQRRDGMSWSREGDLYNGGRAFKITARDARGVIVTIIADNYFGYCKKEVKTQLSYAANLWGGCEEEHAGGAIAFPSSVLGAHYEAGASFRSGGATFEDAMRLLGDRAEPEEGRWATDREEPSIRYVPEDAAFDVRAGTIAWTHAGRPVTLPLRADGVYVQPSGFRIRLERQPGGTSWRLVGTRPEGVLCHKPATVSGGGKSEISKSLQPMLQRAPVFVKEIQRDLDAVEAIVRRDYGDVFRDRAPDARSRRPILSPERSLGSVIQLFTPSPDYTDAHNAFVTGLSQTVRQLVFTLKRHHRPEWGDAWRERFSVDRINGYPGHELKFDGVRLVANYLRVGFEPDDGSWRVFKLRPDFSPAEKIQVEDDITASVVLPRARAAAPGDPPGEGSVKLVANCEAWLFQRPDDAIHPGVDAQAEADLAGPALFASNFEPLSRDAARRVVEHVVRFDPFTEPMKAVLRGFVERPRADWVLSSAHPRLVEGQPSKNPRYLQRRPDVAASRDTRAGEVAARLHRRVPADRPLLTPVDAVLAGRRNNPPGPGVPPLAVYGPIHWQELPELLMDLASSLTGKSPSTTGFGSEGALTKGPFNALLAVHDLNAALVAFALTGHAGFSTAAGHVGPRFRVDHDLSMLVPEVWCRMRPEERDPAALVASGCLERVPDLARDGRTVLSSRLGWRITARFVERYLGRLFETPDRVFTEAMLRPEQQDPAAFADGVDAIVEAQRRVALGYLADGSAEAAVPPLRALFDVMAHGHHEGRGLDDPALRAMFTREAVLASAWYRERLVEKQRRDVALFRRLLGAVESLRPGEGPWDLEQRRAAARAQLAQASAPGYLDALAGTLGADPALAP